MVVFELFFYGKPLKNDSLGGKRDNKKRGKRFNCYNLLSFMEMAVEANAMEILQGSSNM